MENSPAWHILIPVAIGTCLSLIGDSSLYAVLPTHTSMVGVTVVSVGILLSANRFIRLVTNGPMGLAYDHFPRRMLFISALFIGAISTAIYGLTYGFWPLLIGRLLWGLAWSGIWVGGNTIILDISNYNTRGRWIGMYHFSFFLGAASGAILGGILTDMLGFHQAMLAFAFLNLLGAVIALIFLPETRPNRAVAVAKETETHHNLPVEDRAAKASFITATALYSLNRLVVAGILSSTLGLFLLNEIGENMQVAGRVIGVATLTGLGLGLATLIAMVATVLAGWVSDHLRNRWLSAAGGLLPGITGFTCLAVGLPWMIFLGVPLVAMTNGSNQGLSTALIGDFVDQRRQGRQLGVLFTMGDLMSAIGPPLAYGLINQVRINTIYLLSAVLLAILFIILLGRIAYTST